MPFQPRQLSSVVAYFAAVSLSATTFAEHAVCSPTPKAPKPKNLHSVPRLHPPTYANVLSALQKQGWNVRTVHQVPGAKTVVFLGIQWGVQGPKPLYAERLHKFQSQFPNSLACVEGVVSTPRSGEMLSAAAGTFALITGRDPKPGDVATMHERLTYNAPLFSLLGEKCVGTEESRSSAQLNYLFHTLIGQLKATSVSIDLQHTPNEKLLLKTGDVWEKPFDKIQRVLEYIQARYPDGKIPQLDDPKCVVVEKGDDGLKKVYGNLSLVPQIHEIVKVLNQMYDEKVIPERRQALAKFLRAKLEDPLTPQLLFVYGSANYFTERDKNQPLREIIQSEISFILIEEDKK